MYLFRYQPNDGSPPVTISPAGGGHWDLEPKSHAELAAYAGASRSVAVTYRNARLENGPSDAPDQTYSATAHLSDLSGEPLFGLIESGWAPFPFMSADMALMDRNVLSRIENRRADQAEPAGPVDPLFDLSFAGRKVSALPYVLEGRLRKAQSVGEMQDAVRRGTAALRRVLPDATIQLVDSEMLSGLHRLLEDMHRFVTKATPFLREICPSVAEPAGKAQQVQVERKVLRLAREHGIPPTSFAVIAVLSCLYDHCESELPPKMLRPGRAVLKPKKSYSEGAAYGALADLMFIEMLASFQGLGLVERTVFYTHDLGLAAFWSALRPKGFVRTGQNAVSGTMTLALELFPALNEQGCAELRERLSAA